MGVTLDSARLIAAAAAGVGPLRSAVTLGRQWLFADRMELRGILAGHGLDGAALAEGGAWADDFFRAAGISDLHALDNSAYEGADLLHDLNRPLPPELRDRFDLVYDGGTLEHVFHVSTAFANLIQLTRPGGVIVTLTPANNECGHGFYQFSPELFFRLFAAPTGCRLLRLFFIEQRPLGNRWYEVRDPARVGARVACVNRWPLFILALVRRDRVVEPDWSRVQQVDYVEAWGAETGASKCEASPPPPPATGPSFKARVRSALQRAVPAAAYEALLHYYRERVVCSLGNPRFYRRIDPGQLRIEDRSPAS